MTEIRLEHPKPEAVQLVKNALDDTDGISEYHEKANQIVAKTSPGFPRILWSYGETLHIDINEAAEDNITPITINGEKDVPINVGANPAKYKQQFLSELESYRGTNHTPPETTDTNIDTRTEPTTKTPNTDKNRNVENENPVNPEPNTTSRKEVNTANELSDGGSTLGVVFIVILILMFFYWMMVMSMMP